MSRGDCSYIVFTDKHLHNVMKESSKWVEEHHENIYLWDVITSSQTDRYTGKYWIITIYYEEK